MHLASILKVEPTGLAVLDEEKRNFGLNGLRHHLLRWKRLKEKQFIFNYV